MHLMYHVGAMVITSWHKMCISHQKLCKKSAQNYECNRPNHTRVLNRKDRSAARQMAETSIQQQREFAKPQELVSSLRARVNTSFGNSLAPEFPITTGAMKAVTFKTASAPRWPNLTPQSSASILQYPPKRAKTWTSLFTNWPTR